MDDRKKILISLCIGCVALLLLIAGYLVTGSSSNVFLLLSIMNGFLIVALAAVMIFYSWKAKREGMTTQDEMTRAVNHKAGYYAFYVSMFCAIGIMLFNIVSYETDSYLMGLDLAIPVLVIVPGLVYLVLRFYFRGKGILP